MKSRLVLGLMTLLMIVALLVPGKSPLMAAQSRPASPPAPAPNVAEGSKVEGLSSTPDRAPMTEALRSSPVMFIKNVGQFDEHAHFQVRGGMGTMWLAEDAIWINVFEQRSKDVEGPGRDSPPHLRTFAPSPRRGVNLKLSFPGANPHPRIEPFDRLDTVVSYFIGNDPDQWHPDVPVWGGVRYVDLYPSVDLEVTSEGGHWTWRLAVRDSRFAISNVRLRVEGVDVLGLDGDRLHLTTAVGDFILPLLTVEGSMPKGQPSTFNLERGTFEVTSPFSSALLLPRSLAPLQDNPDDLLYSTFLGGSSEDKGEAIAVDSAGSAYITGGTYSSDFPTTAGALDTSHNGDYDAFVVKVNASGTGLAYATFLGGSDYDRGYAIVVDGASSAYVTGYTYSSDFPTTAGALDTSHNGDYDAFVVKVNTAGTGLAYATFLGGGDDDRGHAIAVDGAGSAYVTGRTYSSDFPTIAGAFDTNYNGYYDAFVVKVNTAGTGLAYATFLGGGNSEVGEAITVDGAGSAYVTGETSGSDFPTTLGAFDTSYNGYTEAFVVKVNASGTGLAYATFLGGSHSDWGIAIVVDGASSAYVTGWTRSSDFPTTPGAFDTSYNGNKDTFAVKVNAAGTDLAYATFLGGSHNDWGNAIAVDGAGNAYVTGGTSWSDFPTTPGAFDTSYNGRFDAFVVKVNAGGTGLAYATFLGGRDYDYVYAIAVDGAGSAYVTGYTSSSDFPTTSGAFDTTYNGGDYDAFVAKLAVEPNIQNVELVGQIGGVSYAVAVQGNYAYLGVGPRLVVLDISNPANPTVVGQTEVLPGVVQGVAVAGNYAYVAAGGSLHIINISDPAAPSEAGYYNTRGWAHGVAVAGNYAYVADGSSGLCVINVSDPAAPTEAGFYDTPGWALGVAAAGNYAYIADYDAGLRIINVSDPAAPSEAGFYDTPGSADGVAVAGDYAYVADYDAGLRVINISYPEAPTETGFCDTPGSADDVTVVGNYAYVTDRYGGLRIINISDPAAPTETGFYDTPGWASGVAVVGNYAYVADGYGNLRIINISNPAAPTETGLYDTPGLASGVAVAGDYAYIADYDAGLRIINVSDPAAPTEAGFCDTPGVADDVTVVGNYAYVADGWSSGLRIINVSDPAAPSEAGFYDTPGWASGVAVAGNYAYVANSGAGLRIINVSDPAAPTEAGFCDTPGVALGVAVAGDYAYVANYDAGLRVINISDPAAPSEAGFYDTPGWASGVAVAGNYAYVANSGAGLRIINVSDPAAPTEAGFCDTPGVALGVAVAGDYAYVANYDAGLRVINISDPAAPSEAGFYDTPGWAFGVAMAGNYTYVADREGGLVILRFTGGADTTPPTVVSTYPENGATNVAIDTVVTAAFSEPMDSSTINAESFTLAGSAVAGTVTYDSDTYTATFTPDANLDYDHEYAATLSTAITDEAGNPLAEPYTWSFTTQSTPVSKSWVEVGNPVGSYIIEDLENTSEYQGIPGDFTFSNELEYGDSNTDVQYLQVVLNTNPATQVAHRGGGSPDLETQHFLNRTEDAVERFQALYGLHETDEHGRARVGNLTIEKLNSLLELLTHKPVKLVSNGWVLARGLDGEGNPIEGSLGGEGIRWFNRVVDVTDNTTGWVEREDLYEGGDKQKTKVIAPELAIEAEDMNKLEEFRFVKDDISELLKEEYDLGDLNYTDYYLKPGSKTRGNRFLQLLLKHEGYFAPSIRASGDFGPITEAALKEFQEDNGLPPDGELTPSTIEKLNEILERSYRFAKSRTTKIIESIESNHSDFTFGEIPTGVVLAITSSECGGSAHYDNEVVVENPWGRGIMQIDNPNWYVGNGSGILCFVTTDSGGYTLDKDRCRDNMEKCRCYYTNTGQGIEASIRDGLGVLQDKYKGDRIVEEITFEVNGNTYTITTQDMLMMLTVAAYNGGPFCLQTYWERCCGQAEDIERCKGCLLDICTRGEPLYLEHIGNHLRKLGDVDHFGEQGRSYENDTLAEKFVYANTHKRAIELFSPGNVQVSDAQGRVTGWVEGEVKEEIPNSFYDEETKTITVFFPEGSLKYKVIATEEGEYGLMINSHQEGESGLMINSHQREETDTVMAINIPIASTGIHEYTVDWDALSEGEEGVTIRVDSDGDGIFEQDFTADNDLTQDEFLAGDTTPPSVVTDLAASHPTCNSIALNWTSPGDDGSTGIANGYDIRYSTSLIIEDNWDEATQCEEEPTPQTAGISETFAVTGLSPGTTYYFALKTADEVPNWSGLSNVSSMTTRTPPFCYKVHLPLIMKNSSV